MRTLQGQVAIVTGGGQGVGRGIALALATEGVDVAVLGRTASTLEETCGLLRARGVKAEPFVVDVTDLEAIPAVVADVVAAFGGVDILVNNAIEVRVGDFAEMSYEDIELSALGTFVAPVYCTRVALDHMIPQGHGVVVNVCSEASQTATPLLTVYGALKLGMNGFTNFAGKELARHGIRVVGVNPGCMWGPDRELLPDTPEGLYPLVRTAIQRFQLPEEVANMIAFLSSDAASCMAGTMVDMGGGMSL